MPSDLPEHGSHLGLPRRPVNDLRRFLLNLPYLAVNWRTHVLNPLIFLFNHLVAAAAVVVLRVLHLLWTKRTFTKLP